MAGDEPLIDVCASSDLVDGGLGARFEVAVAGQRAPAFAVRHQGIVRGYLNRCAHVAMELDWQPGLFFDFDGEYLFCSTHGAFYDAADGACMAGPCRGRGGLRPLQMLESDGRVCWRPDDYARPLVPPETAGSA